MNAITRILHIRLGEYSFNAWLSRWGCFLGGITLSGLAVAVLRRHATSPVELVTGSSAAVVACLLLWLLGGLARQVHLLAESGQAPWRSRRWEVVSHAVGVVVLGVGGWAVADALPGVAGVGRVPCWYFRCTPPSCVWGVGRL